MIRIDDREFGLSELAAVARGEQVELSTDERWLSRMRRSRAILDASLSQGQAVYGVSTNVGNRSSVGVASNIDAHARMLVQHHGCGVGAVLTVEQARAVTFTRLVSLAKCYSAVRVELLEALCKLLNAGVTPVIPSLGSVGASGDLTPLSYVAAVLMGEREAVYAGETMPAAEALKRAGLEPFPFQHKETISLMNGTSVMAALAALTALRFEKTIATGERATALAGEILFARSGAFHPIAHQIKPHPGQIASAAAIAAAMQGSSLVDQLKQGRIIQDPYSIRCAPQILGAARDALDWAKGCLTHELNSVNDNPIVDPDTEQILFAGNFYGGHVALAMDLLKIAAASVADLADRQFALVLDSRFNLGLPETLVGYPGNGIKGMELTATALTALAAQRSTSDTIQSRSTEVGNQDKVSMGTNAAVNAGEVVTMAQQVLATHLIALSNAAKVRGEEKLSQAGRAFLQEIRQLSPVLEADRRLDRDIAALSHHIDAGEARMTTERSVPRVPLENPKAVFLVEDGVEWTGERILKLASRIAAALPEKAPDHGVVGVSSPSAGFVLAGVLAAWKLGRAPLLLDPSLKAEPEAVLKRYPGLAIAADAPGAIPGRIIVTEDASAKALEPVWPVGEQVAALFLTSGSTGEAKLVQKTARQLFKQMEAELEWLGVPKDLSLLSLAPPFHIFGFVYGLFLPLQGKGRASFSPKGLPALWIAAMRERKPSLVVGVPFHYRTLAQHTKEPLPASFYFSSGAPLTPDVDAAFKEKTGQSITQGYGSTETGGIAKRIGFGTWHPFPKLEWKIAEEDGRLVIRSPWQENPDEWHVCDDVVTKEDDGFKLLGRADSVVKIAGKRFSTDEVVRAAQGVPGIAEAEALTFERFGEVAVALFAAKAEGSDVDAAKLREALSAKLAPFKVPRTIEVLPGLPRLSNGKVDRQKLKAGIPGKQ